MLIILSICLILDNVGLFCLCLSFERGSRRLSFIYLFVDVGMESCWKMEKRCLTTISQMAKPSTWFFTHDGIHILSLFIYNLTSHCIPFHSFHLTPCHSMSFNPNQMHMLQRFVLLHTERCVCKLESNMLIAFELNLIILGLS